VPVIYDANTPRAVVIDRQYRLRTVPAAGTGIRTRPILAPPTGRSFEWCMRWIEAAAWSASMAWPLSGASGSGPMAEQRESKLVGGAGGSMCEGVAAAGARLVSTAWRCPDPGLAHTFGLHPWIGDGRGE
jgi:hypothetical protein